MSTLKNNSATSYAPGKVKVNANDVLDYLTDKLSGDSTIDVTAKTNSDGSYYLEISVNASVVGTDNFTVKVDAADASPGYLIAKLNSVFGASTVLPDYFLGGANISISVSGAGVMTIASTINMDDILDVDTTGYAAGTMLTYDSVSGNWVVDYTVKASGAATWTSNVQVPTAKAVADKLLVDSNSIGGDWEFDGAVTLKEEYRNYTLANSFPYTALDSDRLIVAYTTTSGVHGLALPSPSAAIEGRVITILFRTGYFGDSSIGIVSSGATINGASVYYLNRFRHTIDVFCDASDWYVIAERSSYEHTTYDTSTGDKTMLLRDQIATVTFDSSAYLYLPNVANMNGGETYVIVNDGAYGSMRLNTTNTETIMGAALPISKTTDLMRLVYNKETNDWLYIRSAR